MYVYLIQSINHPEKHYVGSTDNLQDRLATHNREASIHTSKFAPWKITTYLWFDDRAKAKNFEVYLKTGSGRSFIKNRL